MLPVVRVQSWGWYHAGQEVVESDHAGEEAAAVAKVPPTEQRLSTSGPGDVQQKKVPNLPLLKASYRKMR